MIVYPHNVNHIYMYQVIYISCDLIVAHYKCSLYVWYVVIATDSFIPIVMVFGVALENILVSVAMTLS